MDGDIPTNVMFLNTSAYVSEKNKNEDEIKTLQTDLAHCQQKAEGRPTCYCEVLNAILYKDIICDATYQN